MPASPTLAMPQTVISAQPAVAAPVDGQAAAFAGLLAAILGAGGPTAATQPAVPATGPSSDPKAATVGTPAQQASGPPEAAVPQPLDATPAEPLPSGSAVAKPAPQVNAQPAMPAVAQSAPGQGAAPPTSVPPVDATRKPAGASTGTQVQTAPAQPTRQVGPPAAQPAPQPGAASATGGPVTRTAPAAPATPNGPPALLPKGVGRAAPLPSVASVKLAGSTARKSAVQAPNDAQGQDQLAAPTVLPPVDPSALTPPVDSPVATTSAGSAETPNTRPVPVTPPDQPLPPAGAVAPADGALTDGAVSDVRTFPRLAPADAAPRTPSGGPAPDANGSASQMLSPLPGASPTDTRPSAPIASAQPASGPTPAQQVAPALVAMVHAPDGAPRMTILLQPETLGQVQIHIDRPADGPARVDIAVERPETLTLLLHDQPQLQRVLDQAGVPTDGRSLTIHVAATDTSGQTGGNPLGAGSSQSLAGGLPSSSHGGGFGGGGSRAGGGGSGSGAGHHSDPERPAARWFRAGLDIMA